MIMFMVGQLSGLGERAIPDFHSHLISTSIALDAAGGERICVMLVDHCSPDSDASIPHSLPFRAEGFIPRCLP